MTTSSLPPAKKSHRTVWVVGIIFGIIICLVATIMLVRVSRQDLEQRAEQSALDPFYTPPANIPAKPGTLIRFEPIGADANPPGGTGYRVLYSSIGPDNKPVAVSGIVWVPNNKTVPSGGRKVLAWAHGTIGLAPECAPSRSAQPLMDTQGWLGLAMSNNWVVSATDYLGLGTPGPKTYLVGTQEAKDVTYSVEAARNFEPAKAGKDWVVWGHSQGGHSSLWTGTLGSKLAPDLNLLGVGVAAPAAELSSIVAQQWNTPVGWSIGPEAVQSFSDVYPDLAPNLKDSVSEIGQAKMPSILQKCVIAGALEGAKVEEFGGIFFKGVPTNWSAWREMITKETPKPQTLPMFMAQGTTDTVVLSDTNALLQVQWCKAGVTMQVEWMGQTGHLPAANVGGPAFIEWASGRYAGDKAPSNCSYPPAVKPAKKVVYTSPPTNAP